MLQHAHTEISFHVREEVVSDRIGSYVIRIHTGLIPRYTEVVCDRTGIWLLPGTVQSHLL